MGSSKPMMSNVERGGPLSSDRRRLRERAQWHTIHGGEHDGASMISRTSNNRPFSGADTAIMENAFRQALRKPDFADTPVEDPDDMIAQGHQSRTELLNQELTKEGRDIRSVGFSRGVRVETISSEDGNDTATVQDQQIARDRISSAWQRYLRQLQCRRLPPSQG